MEIDKSFMPQSIEECNNYTTSQLISIDLFNKIDGRWKMNRTQLCEAMVKYAFNMNRYNRPESPKGSHNLREITPYNAKSYEQYMKLTLEKISKLEEYKNIKGRSKMTKSEICKILSNNHLPESEKSPLKISKNLRKIETPRLSSIPITSLTKKMNINKNGTTLPSIAPGKNKIILSNDIRSTITCGTNLNMENK